MVTFFAGSDAETARSVLASSGRCPPRPAGDEEPIDFGAQPKLHSRFSVCSVFWWRFDFFLSSMWFESMLLTIRAFPSTVFCWKSMRSAICGARPVRWKTFVSQVRSRFVECAGGWAQYARPIQRPLYSL